MDEYSRTLDHTFAALAHPTRRKMLDLLAAEELCVTDLAARFSSALNVISKHIKVMERAGLVRREQSGRVHQIHLEVRPLREAATFIECYRERWEGKLDRLGAYLDQMATEEGEATAPQPKPTKSIRPHAAVPTHL